MVVEHNIEVRYGETDQMGVVYHANYVVWFDIGRTKFYESLGFSMNDSEEQGYLYPVKELSVKYHESVKFGEKVKVRTKVHKFTKVKTVYYQEIVNDDGDLKASGYVTIVVVDKETFTLQRFNKVLPDVYESYMKLIG
ncbi:thioesterase family protein [Mycoplasmatota bacterium WC44]